MHASRSETRTDAGGNTQGAFRIASLRDRLHDAPLGSYSTSAFSWGRIDSCSLAVLTPCRRNEPQSRIPAERVDRYSNRGENRDGKHRSKIIEVGGLGWHFRTLRGVRGVFICGSRFLVYKGDQFGKSASTVFPPSGDTDFTYDPPRLL